ncbi:ABC transporter permease [Sedimentibacter sp. zth1]|uniref:ABC transporter permease n=1 Tax=Sedimentibacter sp. zth1 TaxID=2816908 RepID=UPI001A931992|nr:ABC transporter permease [Sedimentibacter sp. zth1]QSX06778.1 ABC transporter permease [Sedimentibacter sp. zth1]
MSKKKNENLIKRVTKTSGYDAFISSLLAIALGLAFGLVVMLIANPMEAIPGFITIITSGFTSLPNVLYFATPILMTGLAVGFAFKMGMFNIGASGQYTMGMFFAMYVGFMIPMNSGVHWIVAILAGMIGGMIWGAIPGIFKAFFNVNEVITSIMFNYIGMYLVDMMVQENSIMYISDMARTNYLPASVQIPALGVTGTNLNFSIIFAIIFAIILYVILNKTTFGYELKATGYNKHASNYAGMNEKKNIILSMTIAGGLAGLGGAFAILAPSTIAGSSMTYEPINIIAANGFNGIAVALLAASNPIGIIFSAFFISLLQRGGTMANLYGFKPEIIDIVISIIIYFSAFAMMMKETLSKSLKRKNNKRLAAETNNNALNYTENREEE